MKYIPTSEVPRARRNRTGNWEKAFDSIPEGMALVLDIVLLDAARNALSRMKKTKGKYPDYTTCSSGDKIYIINPKKKED